MQLLDDPLDAPMARQYWHRTKPNPWEPSRWVRWIGQRGEMDCGIAALAMIVGRSYEAVHTFFPHHGQAPLRRRGLSRADCADFLRLYRCRITWKVAPHGGEEPVEEEWPPAPFGPIHLCLVRRRKGSPNRHWVVLLADGAVLDPETTEILAMPSYYQVGRVGAVTRDDGSALADPRSGPRRIDRTGGMSKGKAWRPRAVDENGGMRSGTGARASVGRRDRNQRPARIVGSLCLLAALAAVLPQLLDLPRRAALYSADGRVTTGTVCDTKNFYTFVKNGDARPASTLETVCFQDAAGQPHKTKSLVRLAPGAVNWLDGGKGDTRPLGDQFPQKGTPAMVRYCAADPAYAVVVGSDEDYAPVLNPAMAMAALLGGLGVFLFVKPRPAKPT